MTAFHSRVYASAQNIFLGSLGAFEAKRWYFSEIMAAEVMGLCMFLMNDHDSPETIKDRSEALGLQAKELAKKSRGAWMDERLKPSLQGPRKEMSQIDRDLDEIIAESTRAIQAAVSEFADR